MASLQKNHLQRGNIEAKRLLDTNNSVRSDTSDKLFSVLEAGESSGIPRDQIDHLLIGIVKTISPDIKKTRNDLRLLLSTKDKIAYISAIQYNNDIINKDLDYDPLKLKIRLDETIKLLECNLMQNQEFTESRILRNAAFNHFSCKLNTSEQSDLNSVGSKLKKLCQDNGYDSLAESTHFTAESNAQKIMNLNEVARQLTAIGVSVDGDTLAKITKLEERVKPLKDLNKKYINLSNNLTMTGEIAKKGYKSMIHVNNQKKLRDFLKEIGKKESDFFLPETDSFGESPFATLEERLRQLKLEDSSKYEELLKKYSTTDNQFSEWFLVYFSYKNVEKSKGELDSQKMKTFGNELKDYEQTAAKRKGGLRDKIFKIGGEMVGDQSNRLGGTGKGKTTMDFASPEEFEVANSYFNKFQNIFYASERDAYGTEAHDKESHYLNMRNVIAAIIRRRGGDAIKNGSHKRYGSLPRKAAKRLEWFAKGQEEKGMLKLLKKTRHHADHAEILAMVIMLQNQASQQMFHGRNTFQKKDNRLGKMRHGLSLAEEGRQKLGKTISPYTSKFMRGVETATKGVVGKPLVRGAQRYNKKLLGKSLSLTQEGELSKATNGDGKYKRRKTPFYAALPATRILAKGKDGYNNTKKYLGEVKGENVNYLYESLNDTIDTVTSVGGKTVEAIGKGTYAQYETNQQRSVLDTFFSLASEDEHWKEVIQSCNLAGIFNFNNRETYLFDEDGRVPMLEAPEVKEKNDLEPKVDEVRKQIEQYEENFKNRFETLESKLDTQTIDSPEYISTKKEIDRIQLILDTIGEEEIDVNGLLSTLDNLAKNKITAIAPDTVEDEFKRKIGTFATNIKNKNTQGQIDLKSDEQSLDDTEKEINKQNIELKRIQKLLEKVVSENDGDKSAKDLKTERTGISNSIRSKKLKINKYKNDIIKKTGDKETLKKENEYLELEKKVIDESLRKEEEKLQKLKDSKNKINNLKHDITTKGIELTDKNNEIIHLSGGSKDKSKLEQEKRKIENIIKITEADIKKLELEFFLGEKDSADKYIKLSEDKIVLLNKDKKTQIEKKNKNEIGILGISIEFEEKSILSIQSEVDKLEIKLKEIDKKLENKSPQTKSWVETKQEEDVCHNEIERLEAEKNKFSKKITTQKEKNRIYEKTNRRGEKINKLADELVNINLSPISYEEKKKMKNKLLKDTNIDFDRTIERKLDLSSLSEDNTRQLFEELNKKYGKAT